MSLIDQAKADIQQIVSNSNEFGKSMTFTSPSDDTTTIIALHTKHHLGVDTEGAPINSRNAHISFSEAQLTAVSYPVRNAAGEVDLNGHKVSVKDSTGVAKQYMIREWYPDETIGLIVCILGDFE